MDLAPPAHLRRSIALSAITVVLLGLLPATALAAHNPGHGDPCGEATPATVFADYTRARRVHRASIDCAFYRGITSGAGTNAQGRQVYRPRRAVTRAQMAQFIVNTLVAAGRGGDLPPGGGGDQFNDIAGSFARIAINQVARAGIVTGTGNGAFSPSDVISRQQMATFIVQAADWAVDPDVVRDGSDRFGDVSSGNVHKRNIEAGADAGLFAGTAGSNFAPGRVVVRDQMATFLVNLLRRTFDESRAPTPYSASATVDDATVDPGEQVTGQVTGSNIRSVTASGCGIAPQQLRDLDEVRSGIQYQVTVPEDQPQGRCALTFTVTFNNDVDRTSTVQIDVQPGNRAAVSLDQAGAEPAGQVTGKITGTNLASARVAGCGLDDEPAEDRDAETAGIQFRETIPPNQATGNCTLVFTVTFVDDSTTTRTTPFTVGARAGATTRPELVQATIVSTTTTTQASSDNPAGTVVRFSFDEMISAPQPARFFVYRSDATRVSADTSPPQTEGGGTVLVRFPSINTASLAADLTTATVDDGAVADAEGQVSPEGVAPLAAAASNPAGITAAPDLLSVGPLRADPQTRSTAVDFNVDETAYTVRPSGFHLVLTDNRVVDCTGPARTDAAKSGGLTAGGNGTTRITAVCPDPAGTQLDTSTVARGYVDPATLSDVQPPATGAAGGDANPLQSAAVGSSGITAGPDLQSVTAAPGAGANDADTVVFAFDDSVRETVAAKGFVVYDVSGREYSGVTAARQGGGGQNRRQVVVTFSPAALDAVAGASVRDGAATDGTRPNRAAEIGIAGPAQTGTPGVTDAPDLVGVALTSSGSGSSEVTTATYTFDEDLNAASGASRPGRFSLYLSDGAKLSCNGTPGTTFSIGTDGSTRRQAVCSSFQIAGAPATAAQVGDAVLGTVDHGAVDDLDSGSALNPEGAVRTSGGTGTPDQ